MYVVPRTSSQRVNALVILFFHVAGEANPRMDRKGMQEDRAAREIVSVSSSGSGDDLGDVVDD